MYSKVIQIFLKISITIIMMGCSSDPFSPKVGDANGSLQDLSLTLQLDKDIYSIEDQILVKETLKNISGSRITVKKRMLPAYYGWDIKHSKFHDVIYSIKSPSGNYVQLGIRYRAPELSAEDFVSLSRGESIQFSFDLKKDRIFPDEYGLYSVFLVYVNYYDPSWFSMAWKGELTSNTVYFEIER